MSETRREPVVCHCHRCSRLQFRKRDGNWASGAIVSSATKISHAAVDTQMVARFQTSRDSDDDEDEDEDDDDDSPQSPKKINHSESPHVRRLNNDIEQIHLSSRHPGPNRSEVYDCSRFYKFTLKNVDPAVLHMSLLAAMLSVFDHVSVATSSWFLKSGKELLTLAASGGLGDRDNDQGLNLLQENTLDALPSDIRTVLARLQIEPTLVTVICCPSCWAMYPKPAPREDDAPETAAQTAQKNAPKIPAAPTGPTRCINKVFPKEDGARVKQLRLSKWHCQRFWCMADVAEEEEPEKIPKLDVNGMRRDVTHRTLAALVAQSDSDSDDNGVPFNQMEFASTESSDNSFSPFLEAEGWGTGAWIRPTEGQLEITFLTNFCRIGNLQAVLSASETYPAQLMPFINQLKAFHDPIHVEAETIPKRRQGSLDSSTLQILVKRLNDLFPCPTGATWLSSDAWAKKRKAEASKFLSVASRIKTLSSCVINEVRFSTYKENPSNSVIVLQPGCAPQYSIIEQIFQHWRTLGNGTSTADIWLVTQPLLPCSFPNPFAGLQDFEVGVELRTFQTDETDTLYINHTQEVLAHCAWIKYRPSEIIRHIKKECIALVSLER
ncbi:hypothetical protein KEM48_003470 [Puccinia striiformis f. sp. tritici PST-130]|nr:hypothetical protein KEM48_003470 [Puccinia striiformis f. sp. tritici PST-130]